MDSDSGKRAKKKAKLEDSEVTIMAKLPPDLIVDIISRLPISSLVNFSYVCRSWRSLAREPFILEHLSRITQNSQCLIFHCDSPLRSELCYVEYLPSADHHKVHNFHPNLFASMPEFDVVASCDGILCLSDSLFDNKLYLYNPFTNCMKILPKSVEYPNSEVLIGFGYLQKTNEFKVIQIVYYQREGFRNCPCSKVLILTLGNSNWREIGSADYQFVQSTSQVLVDGRLHWVTQAPKFSRSRAGNIVSFDLENEQFEDVPKPCCGALNKYDYHLLVIRGCLSAASPCWGGRLEIWVMRNYGVKGSWSKQYIIKKNVPRGPRIQNGKLDFLKTFKRTRNVRVLCILKNGEILLEYEGKALATYEPTNKRFKDIRIHGTPKLFQVVHAGNFSWDCALSKFDR